MASRAQASRRTCGSGRAAASTTICGGNSELFFALWQEHQHALGNAGISDLPGFWRRVPERTWRPASSNGECHAWLLVRQSS